jgi:hypothetical protein
MAMKSLAVLIIICFSVTAFSQEYVGQNRKKVKERLEKYISKTKVYATFQETDSTLTLSLRDPKFANADFLYHFNKPVYAFLERKV